MKKLQLLVAAALAAGMTQGHAEVYGEEARPDVDQASIAKFKHLSRPNAANSPLPSSNVRPDNSVRPVKSSAQSEVAINAQPLERWQLTAGHLVRQDLMAWGERSGWKVLWHLQRDWAVPANTEFTGDFKSAAAEVITTLAENGVVIRGQFFDANKTLVISGASPLTPDPQ